MSFEYLFRLMGCLQFGYDYRSNEQILEGHKLDDASVYLHLLMFAGEGVYCKWSVLKFDLLYPYARLAPPRFLKKLNDKCLSPVDTIFVEPLCLTVYLKDELSSPGMVVRGIFECEVQHSTQSASCRRSYSPYCDRFGVLQARNLGRLYSRNLLSSQSEHNHGTVPLLAIRCEARRLAISRLAPNNAARCILQKAVTFQDIKKWHCQRKV
jgi:hypothetical protein